MLLDAAKRGRRTVRLGGRAGGRNGAELEHAVGEVEWRPDTDRVSVAFDGRLESESAAQAAADESGSALCQSVCRAIGGSAASRA